MKKNHKDLLLATGLFLLQLGYLKWVWGSGKMFFFGGWFIVTDSIILYHLGKRFFG